MTSFSGPIHRPLVAAAAVAVASFSTEISDKFPSLRSRGDCSTSNLAHSPSCNSLHESKSSWVSHISVSKLSDLSFVSQIRSPVPDVNFLVPSYSHNCVTNSNHSSVASSILIKNLYNSADLSRVVPRLSAYSNGISNSASEVMYKWHLPQTNSLGDLNCSSAKSRTVVVLLGWLGARQKHMKKYAEWYTSKGYHVITFTFPMSKVLSYQPGGKAEENVHLLVDHLADWLEGENEKNLVFHTFSNTGWLTYGVILEHFQKQDPSVMERIRGCIVDSAPVSYADPHVKTIAIVWALGFSAAFLKKNSVATKGRAFSDESTGSGEALGSKPAATEVALLLILEKFFEVILYLPSVNRRLSDVLSLLSSKQPSCPQLYIYSSADRVIPADSVESFVETQRRAGHDVRACNFVSSPHVDHFRNDPHLYTSQLSQFLDKCVTNRCKSSH